MNNEEINIWWEGPFKIDDIINGIKKYDNIENEIGIYQIYGTHPLYGHDKLLYIGRTQNKNGFKSRLKNRWVIENGVDSENVKIYLGTIFSHSEHLNDSKIETYIEKAEVLLINTLKPAFNSSNIQSVDKKLQKQNYIIYNHNNYRDIYPILSSWHFWQDYLNTIITDKLANKFKAKIIDNDEYYMFALPTNDNIFIGVDYDCWSKKNAPLIVKIKSLNNINKKEIENTFELLQYKDKKIEYYYISLAKNLKDKDAIENISKIIADIESILK